MSRPIGPDTALIDAVRRAARQEQFLEVVSAEEATRRFRRHLDLVPHGTAFVPLADALGRVLAHDVAAPIDVPPFDRSGVELKNFRLVGFGPAERFRDHVATAFGEKRIADRG